MHDASRATSGALSNRISTEVDREDEFPIATQIRAAADDAGRARLLLRLPDDAIVSSVGDLIAACSATEFTLGISYLAQRSRTLCATRTKDGRLPLHLRSALRRYRRDLARVAGVRG